MGVIMIGSQSFDQIAFEDFDRLAEHMHPEWIAGKRILITGGTGFFGIWLMAYFFVVANKYNAKFEIYVVTRNPHAFKNKNPWLKNESWINWITGDVAEFSFPDVKVDFILHAATDTSEAAGKNAGVMLKSIIAGAEHILDCAKHCEVERITLVSSGGAYGSQSPTEDFLCEDANHAPSTISLGSAYGEGKRVMELLGTIFAEKTGRVVSVARCFAFVGAGLPTDGHFAIGNFVRDAIEKDEIVINGDGKAIRSYLYAADLALWLMRILCCGESKTIYNVGSDLQISTKELAETVVNELAPGKHVKVLGSTKTSPVGNKYIPSVQKAKLKLGLDVWTPLPLAIRRMALLKKVG